MSATQAYCFAPYSDDFMAGGPWRNWPDIWRAGRGSVPQAPHRLWMIFLLMLLATMFGAVRPAIAADQCVAVSRALPVDALPVPLKFPEWRLQYEHLKSTVSEPRMSSRRLLFIGDSLTYGWHQDETLFYQSFKQYNPLNLGIFGDRTEGVIYRLNTDWGALNPRLAVVLIGTNNTASGSNPSDVAMAIAEIVKTIRTHSGQTRVLIVSILPRGDKSSAVRSANNKVNEIVSGCVNGTTTFFADVAASFLDESGKFKQELTSDNVHLTQRGYQQLASLILPTIKTLMTD